MGTSGWNGIKQTQEERVSQLCIPYMFSASGCFFTLLVYLHKSTLKSLKMGGVDAGFITLWGCVFLFLECFQIVPSRSFLLSLNSTDGANKYRMFPLPQSCSKGYSRGIPRACFSNVLSTVLVI